MRLVVNALDVEPRTLQAKIGRLTAFDRRERMFAFETIGLYAIQHKGVCRMNPELARRVAQLASEHYAKAPIELAP